MSIVTLQNIREKGLSCKVYDFYPLSNSPSVIAAQKQSDRTVYVKSNWTCRGDHLCLPRDVRPLFRAMKPSISKFLGTVSRRKFFSSESNEWGELSSAKDIFARPIAKRDLLN